MAARQRSSLDLTSTTLPERVRWVIFFVIVAASVAEGQKPSTIFDMDFLSRDFYVPNSDAKVDVLGPSNFTCFDDFVMLNTSTFALATDSVTRRKVAGSCVYNNAVQLLEAPCRTVTSFSTMFHMTMFYENDAYSGDLEGLVFFISSDQSLQGQDGGYLGWLNSSDNGQQSGHNFAIELDFFRNLEFGDPDYAHVGVNLNSMTSDYIEQLNISEAFFTVWIDYDTRSETLNVTVANDNHDLLFKPLTPLVSMKQLDLSKIITRDQMFIGFAGALANLSGGASSEFPRTIGYYILTWTFNSNGQAPDLQRDSHGMHVDLRAEEEARKKARAKLLASISVPTSVVFVFLAYIIYLLQRRNARLNALAKKYHIEQFELLSLGPRTFKYKELVSATKDFSPDLLVGTGGFGSVYRGTIRFWSARSEESIIAVKRISKTSNQGVREFLAEVKIISQVHHRNLVRLLGWCQKKAELLLVYDYMPNGSLDQHLFKPKVEAPAEQTLLTWTRRLTIVSGVAKALAYLHDHGEQRVIHRDVKSANVMLDSDFNARLGDFGLARLSNHDQEIPTTENFAGTRGYVPPEQEATEKTDVYSFGVVVLEVATGKRALLRTGDGSVVLLVDWVRDLYTYGKLLDAADSRLENSYDTGEMMTLLKIGLCCTHFAADDRPTMGDVLDIWKGSKPFPALQSNSISASPVFSLQSCLYGDTDTTMTSTDLSNEESATFTRPGLRPGLEQSEPVQGSSLQPSDLELRSRPWKRHTALPM